MRTPLNLPDIPCDSISTKVIILFMMDTGYQFYKLAKTGEYEIDLQRLGVVNPVHVATFPPDITFRPSHLIKVVKEAMDALYYLDPSEG